MNLKRNRKRTAVTILSIVMSITVFVALQGFTEILDTGSEVQKMHTGDYAITNETTGIEPESVLKLEGQEMVTNLSTAKLTIYSQDENGELPVDLDFSLQSWESFQIAAIDDVRLVDYVSGLTQEESTALETGTACIVKNTISMSYEGQEIECTELKKGDHITINGKELQVIGIANEAISVNNEGYLNGIQIIVTNSIYDILTGNARYSEVYPTLTYNADAAAFENWLDSWCKDNPGSHWLSYRQFDTQLAESFEQIKFLCWGLILFIGMIGVLNIINTVYTNIHTRISEIGMQRAMGMSSHSLYKTFLWEGVYYGIIASIIGAVCGYICTIFVGGATTDSLQLVQIPTAAILEAAIVSVIICLTATAVPLCSIGKMSIVDSIENVE